jgi:hypothetical protein
MELTLLFVESLFIMTVDNVCETLVKLDTSHNAYIFPELSKSMEIGLYNPTPVTKDAMG